MLFQWLLLLLTESCKCRFIQCGLHVDAGTILLLYSHDCSKIIVMMGVVIDTENWYNAATHWGPWLSHPIIAWISSQKNWKKIIQKNHNSENCYNLRFFLIRAYYKEKYRSAKVINIWYHCFARNCLVVQI